MASLLGLLHWHFAIMGVGGVILIVAIPTIICITVLLIRHKRGMICTPYLKFELCEMSM